MGDAALEVECLEQLRDYIISLGGDWNDDWKCRAQIRDYGSRAGSVDTWFTSPDGEVFRSKVAAARALGLDCSKGTNTKRPKAPRKPASTRAAAADKSDRSGGEDGDGDGDDGERKEKSKPKEKGGSGAKESNKWAGTVAVAPTPRPVDLTMDEIGELLLSMPDATDIDDCYEGPLFYKEAQLKHASKMAARAAAAAAAKEAEEREAVEMAAAEAASLVEARRREEREARRRERALAAGFDSDVEMPDADDGDKKKGKGSGEEGDKEEAAEEEEEEEEEDEGPRGRRGRGGGRRATRQSLAAAVAAAAALLQSHSGIELPAHMVAAMTDAGDLLEDGGDADAPPLPPPGPPQLDHWSTELEVIRKCFVKVPDRLGRPDEDEPVPMSPSDRQPELTRALLALADGAPAEGEGVVDGEPREGAASLSHWQLKRFPLDQLTANEGEPSALHPAALFYLRHLEEEFDQEERAVRREAEERAARKEQKRLERQNATGPDGAPRAPLPKPANLSLRGKSIEEVEDALMERLSSYVGDLGGVLPDGWRVKASIRQNGANAGGVDAYYYDPSGRRHKSMVKVAEVLGLEASAAAKPKTLASILGTTSKRRPTVDDDDMMDRPGGVIFAGEGEEPAAAVAGGGGGGDGGAGMDGELGDGVGGDGVGGGDGSPGLGVDGSGRKTCGVCRTCLNPSLKKGCLANKARTGPKSRSRQAMDSSPSPSPPPPKKLTARQMAKIERQAREAAEREAMRAAAEVAAAADEVEEGGRVPADAEAGADGSAKDSEDSEIDIVGGGPAVGKSAGTSAEPADPAPGSEGPSVDPPNEEGQAPVPEAAEAMEEDAGEAEGDGDVAPAPGVSPTPNGGPRSGSAVSGEDAGGDGSGGSKRARGEGAAEGAGGSGGSDALIDDAEEAERQTKRPRQENGESAEEGAAPLSPRDPYPRRERKQVKPQPPPGHPPPPDLDAKKKKVAEVAARRAKRKLDDTVRNVYDKAYNRLKGQMSRMRQETALVEAYAADGWRGASREKVKPVAEIKRAKEQIKRCREAVRECVRVCDEAEGDVPIPAEFYDEEGELDLDHIFCSKCRGNESTDDNDIILCDGPCDRAYHVKCLVPPVDPATLPEDEGWLCPACDRKIDMIDDINDEFGTEYEYETSWEVVLAPGTLPASPEAAAPTHLGAVESWLEGADLPSEDEEDEDYEESGSDDEGPAGDEEGEEKGDGGGGEDAGGGDSGSESDDEASSLASEDLGGEILDIEMTSQEREALASRYAMPDSSEDSEEKLIVEGKRRRTAVDYRALNAEMFGDVAITPDAAAALEAAGVDEGGDSDEGWSPRAQARKDREEAKRRKKEEEEEEESEEEEEEEEEKEKEAAGAEEDAGGAEEGEGGEDKEGGDA